MKIKNKASGIRPGGIFILFCAAVLVCVPLRMYQMLHIIDPDTGFYSDTSNITIPLLYGIAGVVMLLILLLSYLSGDLPASVPPQGKKPVLGIAAIVFAFTLVYDAMTAWSSISGLSTASASVSGATVHSGMVPLVCETGFGFLSAVYFVLLGVSCLTGRNIYSRLRVLALSPAVWAMSRVIFRFTRTISFIKVPELLAEFFGLIFAMIFFLVFARLASGVSPKGNMWSVLSCGLCAALAMYTYSIPRFILVVTQKTDLLVKNSDFFPCDLLCAVFITVFLIIQLRSGVKQSAEDAIFGADETPEKKKKNKGAGSAEIPTSPLPAKTGAQAQTQTGSGQAPQTDTQTAPAPDTQPAPAPTAAQGEGQPAGDTAS